MLCIWLLRGHTIGRTMLLGIALAHSWSLGGQSSLQHIRGVNYADVKIQDDFWSPKIEKVATNALGVCIYQTEVATPRIRNFEKVAAAEGEAHEGIYFDDSDVYKAIEAMAYALHSVPDTALEAKADEWIDKIAAAQLDDGYLNTFYTLQGLEDRWQDMERHEAYCAGHLMEAAIAYYEATGKRKLLDVAIRLADHIDRELRMAGKPWVAGHQEIELALVKLYRTTGEARYLDLSSWFLDQRGRGFGKGKIWDHWQDPAYCQDAIPVREQTEITGHAVRAMYMYTGIADLASITEDRSYLETMRQVWEDVVHRNTYVTGGIGSAGTNEGFSVDYDLPNEEAYCETCASVGMVFWNQRMNWLTGEAKYLDVLERSLYNSALDGISLDGKQFFYPNPLASHGQHARKDWFGTACCPSNISRLVTSIGNYVYGVSDRALWINLFIGSETTQHINGVETHIQITTAYPLSDRVTIKLTPAATLDGMVHIRIPGWARDQAFPGGLYEFVDRDSNRATVRVNGTKVNYPLQKGYAVIQGKWESTIEIEVELPMQPRKVISRPEVSQNEQRVALQYGPLIYCLEEADNPAGVFNIIVPEETNFTPEAGRVGAERIVKLVGNVPALQASQDGRTVETMQRRVEAIPYYSWCNRGSNDMLVWLPTVVGKVAIE